ncbi:Gfo/Idh/MocA family protein [Jiangella gansuensis]|uniref:Gfo/Idh/MocA family protein n=1 Tax=Jiangella gansuensis TaxID=281473 RepID=UPI00047E7CF8|nr:Gfo/Idh/MocA family oxidoreductase [Jiangella gansuensis]
MRTRIGIVGAGAMAEQHAIAMRDAGAEIVGVADPDHGRAAALADTAGAGAGTATAYGSAQELYAHPGIDAVVVASPNETHAAQTIAALNAGLHVLTEIPVGMSLAEAEAVADAAVRSGLQVAVAHTLRYCSPYRQVRELVDAGRLEIRHIVARTLMLRQENTGVAGRRRTWTDDVRWHHGAHTVDAALWLLAADDATVTGQLGPAWPRSGRPMDAGIVLCAPGGGVATIALSYHSRVAARDLTIIAEGITLRIDGPRLLSPDGVIADCGSAAAMERAGLTRQDEDFLTAIVHGRRPECTVQDVLPTMRALDRLSTTTEA